MPVGHARDGVDRMPVAVKRGGASDTLDRDLLAGQGIRREFDRDVREDVEHVEVVEKLAVLVRLVNDLRGLAYGSALDLAEHAESLAAKVSLACGFRRNGRTFRDARNFVHGWRDRERDAFLKEEAPST